MSGSSPLRAIGGSGRTPAPHIGHAPKARTSAASATSSQAQCDRRPSVHQLVGHCKRILTGGCARLQTAMSMAPPASGRSNASCRDEAAALRPLDGRPPFGQMRELIRRVRADATVELDTNAYSVPWRLIGETVQIVVAGGRVSVRHRGREVAIHGETTGRRQRVAQLAGYVCNER